MDDTPGDQPRDPYAPQYGTPPGYGQAGYGATAPPGWYPDPYGSGSQRYWDGNAWGQQAYQPQPAKTGTDGVAIAAFVVSLIGGVLFAVVLAIVALNRVGRSHRPGRGLAIAALAISAVWLTGVVVYLANEDPSASGSITGTRLSGAQLVTGQCLEVPDPMPATGRVFELRQCTAAHNGEVMTTDNLPAGDYPGLDQIKATVLSSCQAELRSYTGSDVSTLHVVYLYPTADSWAGGDQRYVCVAVDRIGDVTKTMRGSKL